MSATGTEARVCADIAARQALGLRKYGVTVEANPLTQRQWLQHAYEEALDLAIYLRRAIEQIERDAQPNPNPPAEPAPTPRSSPLNIQPIPAIGQPWPGVDGLYAGLSRGADGQPDAHLVLLTVKSDKELNWQDAIAWAAALGDDAHLPTRDESALLYAHLREACTDGWHWTSTQFSESFAWGQIFYYGGQSSSGKEYEGHARAVRRFPA